MIKTTTATTTTLSNNTDGQANNQQVGLHMRLVGSPKYAMGISRLLDYVKSMGDDVWVTTRSDIARHWWETNPGDLRP